MSQDSDENYRGQQFISSRKRSFASIDNDSYDQILKDEFGLTEEQVLLQEEKVDPFIQNEQVKQDIILDNLDFSLIPRQNIVQLSSNNEQILPVSISINTIKKQQQFHESIIQKEQSLEQQEQIATRPPIDIVCVVDVSGSMEGEKLQLVKNSLRYIMKILSPFDRISIVIFETNSSIILPWLLNNATNKEKIKSTILGIKSMGSTNIASGVEKGLYMLKSRQFKNPISLMFVLSDGQDDQSEADIKVSKLIKEANIQEIYTINTFGYGKDHDSNVMNNIATYTNGNFYFIENIQKASEYFVLSMSGMLSIFAQDVQINLEEIQDYEGIGVHKLYGDSWSLQMEQQTTYNMKQNYLLAGDIKSYLFEISIPRLSAEFNVETQKKHVVMRAYLTGQLVGSEVVFEKSAHLELLFINEESLQVNDLQVNEKVEIDYLRTLSGDIIGRACALAQEQLYEQAIQILNKMNVEVKNSKFSSSPLLIKVVADIEKSIEMCQPQKFQQHGQAFLMKKQRNHLQRQASYENIADWDTNQQKNMQDMEDGKLALSIEGDSPPPELINQQFHNQENYSDSDIMDI